MATSFGLPMPRKTAPPAQVDGLSPEVDHAKSEVDFDAEYSDREDEKIREQLFNGPVKPSDTLPGIQKLKEAELKEVSTSTPYYFCAILTGEVFRTCVLPVRQHGKQAWSNGPWTPIISLGATNAS